MCCRVVVDIYDTVDNAADPTYECMRMRACVCMLVVLPVVVVVVVFIFCLLRCCPS